MSTNVRRVTNDVISAVEDGFLDWETVARAALDYLSEDEVIDMVEINDWAIADDEEDEEDDIEDDIEDEEKKSFVDSLSEETLDKIWKIAERYNTSSPISGNWDTETLHERDAIVKELGLTKEEANEVMIEYLGFDALDLEEDLNIEKSASSDRDGFKCVLCGKYSKGWGANKQHGNNPWPLSDEGDCCDNCNREKVIPARLAEMENKILRENKKKKVTAQEVCPECEKEVGEDGHCYNQECVAYDPVSQYFEEQVEEDVLVKNGYYDELDFHEAGLLIGDIELQYKKLPVIDQFDEDIEIDHTFTVFISPDMVIDFLCAQRGLDRKKLTVNQAQKHIDDLAKNPKDLYQYLKEHFAEEATEEAQYKIAESYKHKAKENFELDDDDDVLGWSEK